MKKITIFTLLTLSTLPIITFAQTLGNINDVAKKATSIGNLIIELIISIALVWIIINIVRYYVIAGGEDDRKKGGMAILYGVVALFVILSIWGIVSLLTGTFRFTNNQRPSFNNLRLSPNPSGLN